MLPDIDSGPDLDLTRLIFYPLLLLASTLWIFHRWQEQSRFHKMGNLLPGPETVPFFGNALIALGKTNGGKLLFAL